MTDVDLDVGNNGPIKVADLVAQGAQVLSDGAALRMPSGAVLQNIVPPMPFDDNDDLNFAQSCVSCALKYERKLADIAANPRFSDVGKVMEMLPAHHEAIRGAAVSLRKVELATDKIDKDLAGFYEPPAIGAGDTVSPLIDSEARNYIRSLSPDEVLKLINRLDETGDPRIMRALLGIVRSPLPIASLIEQSAHAAWRNLRERSEPDVLGKLQARKKLADWAGIVVSSASGLIAGRIQIAVRDAAKHDTKLAHGLRRGIFSTIDGDDFFRPALAKLGFASPVENEEIRRALKLAA